LSRLWSTRGETKRAHGLLASIYGSFVEGFETADLVEAKTLLDSIS
jgi:predicted ATPase